MKGAKLSSYTDTRDNNFNIIRFIAASLVLYAHSFPIVAGPECYEPLQRATGMTWGVIAVDVFFVISGFLVTSSLFARRNLVAFVWARVMRIYPGLIVAIVFCVFVVGLSFTKLETSEYLCSRQTYKYLIRNTTLIFGVVHHLPGVFSDLPARDAVNGSLWTLPYEVKMYGYLAFVSFGVSAIQRMVKKNLLKWVFVGVTSVSVVANIASHYMGIVDAAFLRLFAMFFAGGTAFLYREKIPVSAAILTFLAAALLLATVNRKVFFLTYNLAIAYFVLNLAYVPAGRIRKFNKIGDYSYGIYIYAFPVQQAVVSLYREISIYSMMSISYTITLMLAFASWHLIEKRAIKKKDSYVLLGGMFRNALGRARA